MNSAPLNGWLAQAGLRNMPLEDIVEGFGRRLNEAGLKVERMFVGMNTLHPMVRARSLIWDEAENRIHAQKSILAWCFGAIG